MVEEQQDSDRPSLELPSLFRRRSKPVTKFEGPEPRPAPVAEREPTAPRPRRQVTLPIIGAQTAAVVTGALVGLLAVGLTWLAVRGCEALRDTSSCGDPGLLVLLGIVVVVGLAGRVLLGALRVPEAGSTSFLATALMAVLAMLFLAGSLADTWMLVVLPVLGAVSFAVAQWVTSTNTTPGDRAR